MSDQDPTGRASIRRALKKTQVTDWSVQRTDYDVVKERLDFDPVEEIRSRLGTEGKVIFLELGCGEQPLTLRAIAEVFPQEISGGRLELHATHITRSKDWADFIRRHSSYPVTFHRATLLGLAKKGINAHVILDHFGPVNHSVDKLSAIKFVRDHLLLENGVFGFNLASVDAAKLSGYPRKGPKDLNEVEAKYRKSFQAFVGFPADPILKPKMKQRSFRIEKPRHRTPR